MIRGFYSARSGLTAHQEQMNVISNNMANVNTVGFKPMRVSFTDLMYKNLNRAEAENPAMIGHGAKINKTDTNVTVGPLELTNSYLDFAITGEGYFALENASGDITYTRAGNFIMSLDEGGTYWLAAANGDRVLDAEGEHIEIEFEQIEQRTVASVDEDGTIHYNPVTYVDGAPVVDMDQIGVYTFSNPYGLSNLGNNRYAQTDVPGEATALEQPSLREGYLEGSGVEVSVEMVKVIESSRAFSFNSRMIQVADEIEQTINSLR